MEEQSGTEGGGREPVECSSYEQTHDKVGFNTLRDGRMEVTFTANTIGHSCILDNRLGMLS